MGRGILVTGGARSGKSNYAEDLAKKLGENILYIATSIPFDDEMKERVRKHKASRPEHWLTYEGYKKLGTVLNNCVNKQGTVLSSVDGVLIDCVTVMITNLMFDMPRMKDENYELIDFNIVETEIMNEAKSLMEAIKNLNKTVILVTNEVGFGIVPESKLGRVFRDIAGRVNQYIASRCDEVYLTVCGISMKVK